MVTWAGHGIRLQLEQRIRDIGSVFCRTSIRFIIKKEFESYAALKEPVIYLAFVFYL